jgi:hypothetical protein
LQLTGEPNYPTQEPEISIGAMIIGYFFGTCVVFILAIILIMYLLRYKVRGYETEDSPLKLYDVQKPGELLRDEARHDSQAEQMLTEPRELPASPYDTAETGYL